MEKQRVVIVNEGAWGGVKKDTYDSVVRSIKRLLGETTKKNHGSGEEKKRAESVMVVESTKKAMEKVKRNDVDVLIFNSRSMIPEARKIKGEYRWLKVVVLTGLIPDDEVILMNKGWMLSSGSSVLEVIVFD